MQRPIIGFNVIEEILNSRENQVQPSESIALLRNSLKLGSGKAEALLNLIHRATKENVYYPVGTGRTSVVVPGGQIKCITCPVKTDLKVNTEALFEPEENLSLDDGLKLTCWLISVSCSSRKVHIYVRNTTQHDITMPSKTVIGGIQRITDCYPVYREEQQVNSVVVENHQTTPCSTTEMFQGDPQDKLFHPPVNVDHLTSE